MCFLPPWLITVMQLYIYRQTKEKYLRCCCCWMLSIFYFYVVGEFCTIEENTTIEYCWSRVPVTVTFFRKLRCFFSCRSRYFYIFTPRKVNVSIQMFMFSSYFYCLALLTFRKSKETCQERRVENVLDLWKKFSWWSEDEKSTFSPAVPK